MLAAADSKTNSAPKFVPQDFNATVTLLRDSLAKAMSKDPPTGSAADFDAARLIAENLKQTLSQLSGEDKRLAMGLLPEAYASDPTQWVQAEQTRARAAASALARSMFFLQARAPDIAQMKAAKNDLEIVHRDLPGLASVDKRLSSLQTKIELEQTKERSAANRFLEDKKAKVEMAANDKAAERESRVRTMIRNYYSDPAEEAQYFTRKQRAFHVKKYKDYTEIDKEVRAHAKGRETTLKSLDFISVAPSSLGFDVETKVVIFTSKFDDTLRKYHHQVIQFNDTFSIVEEDGEFKISGVYVDPRTRTKLQDYYE